MRQHDPKYEGFGWYKNKKWDRYSTVIKLLSWFYFIPHLFELSEIARYTGELQYDKVPLPKYHMD